VPLFFFLLLFFFLFSCCCLSRACLGKPFDDRFSELSLRIIYYFGCVWLPSGAGKGQVNPAVRKTAHHVLIFP